MTDLEIFGVFLGLDARRFSDLVVEDQNVVVVKPGVFIVFCPVADVGPNSAEMTSQIEDFACRGFNVIGHARRDVSDHGFWGICGQDDADAVFEDALIKFGRAAVRLGKRLPNHNS